LLLCNKSLSVQKFQGILMARNYPFSAIVGQEDMKLAILIAALDSSVGGVLVMGDRGTGKSTAVRALAALLPEMNTVQECVYACDPNAPAGTWRKTQNDQETSARG
jgi:magnesium chelatase subunit I